MSVLFIVPGIPETTYLTALKKFPNSHNHFLMHNNNHIDDKENNDHSSSNSNSYGASGGGGEKTPSELTSCTNTKKMWSSCQCHLELCIGWYPCGLKYCKGKGQSKNSVMTYRCGIKTCRKCHLFAYYVSQKQQCLWDEWPTYFDFKED